VAVNTREPQYGACFDEAPVTLGPMTGSTWRWNPRRLGMVLARYKFVAKMLSGLNDVAEIGCADAFASAVVAQEVGRLALFDFDPAFVAEARRVVADIPNVNHVAEHDILAGALGRLYDAIYMLDVLEHIAPLEVAKAMTNVVASLQPGGIFIAGVPSLESQAYASAISRAGHVNCQSGHQLRNSMRRFFANVFLFGMNDEVLHTGFAPMCHYLFVLCTGPLLPFRPRTP
jgi:SAM-dependent methyltransferase